jgi:ribosomal small subunit protein bTHX
MGRGDRKTTKGKIAIRSYGNARPHAGKPAGAGKGAPAKPAATTAAVAKKPAARKAAPRKAAAKKSV